MAVVGSCASRSLVPAGAQGLAKRNFKKIGMHDGGTLAVGDEVPQTLRRARTNSATCSTNRSKSKVCRRKFRRVPANARTVVARDVV